MPRHPERALFAVAAALPYPELRADLLSRLPDDWDVAVADRIGLLFDLYAAALPRQSNEFTCASCFLVKSQSQLAETKGDLKYCVDCV